MIKYVEKPNRDEICMNGSWEFSPIKDIPKWDWESKAFTGLVKPNESQWEKTPLKVPSPWNVNGFTNGQGGDFKSYPSYPKAWDDVKAGWMRKKIKVPSNWSNNRIILHFEAVAGYAKVFINGVEVGDHFDTFLPFSFDVSEHIKADNELEVLVFIAHGSILNDRGKYGRRNYVAGSFWGIYIAGIWQDVYLHKLPNVYISDTYVKPEVDKDVLELEVTVKNTTNKAVKFNLNAKAKRWVNLNGKSDLYMPETNWKLGSTDLSLLSEKLLIAANSETTFKLKTKVNGALDLWSPDSPNLYGLIVSLNQKKTTVDKDYTRFGWRQFKISGEEFKLNGSPFVIKGDSWHFMGIPQLTRRYAYSWFKMLLDANANGCRLHAQVFPRFYLEMADEMGICILDETAIWSSDGGPKIDSDIYWEACRTHVKELVLRDRNYPSVFGWSVCNETLPVTKHVFNAPQHLIDKNVAEINEWIALTRKYDPTRNWISGDGETQAKTDLPTVIGHYGNYDELIEWSERGKPWGIGETGMGYYGTPLQVSKINGDRAFESQEGRMEGLAGEAFELLSKQQDHHASYVSVFNLAWYGLKPLELGLSDISRAPKLTDGIFFNSFVEGKPGYQPERLGPYTTTFNPGYDPNLPLYSPWALFDAVKAANSKNYKSIPNRWAYKHDNTVKVAPLAKKHSIVYLSSNKEDELQNSFKDLAIKFDPLSIYKNQLIIVNGENPPSYSNKLVSNLKRAISNGSSLVFWGTTKKSKQLIDAISGSNLEFYNRTANSYIINNVHPILNGENNKSYYFSEITKKDVSDVSIGGDWVNQNQVLLKACNTDWHYWNYRGEAIKTAKVYRNEREKKPVGNIVVRQAVGKGELIVSTLNLFSLGRQANNMVTNLITNMGGEFKGEKLGVPEAFNKDFELTNALFLGSFDRNIEDPTKIFENKSIKMDQLKNFNIGTAVNNLKWDIVSSNNESLFNVFNLNIQHKQKSLSYLSFWIYSPRSLTDLLIEPDMPRLDLKVIINDPVEFMVNGKVVKQIVDTNALIDREFTYEGFPLEKGWNHIVICTTQSHGSWPFKAKFTCTKPNFLKELKTIVDRKQN